MKPTQVFIRTEQERDTVHISFIKCECPPHILCPACRGRRAARHIYHDVVDVWAHRREKRPWPLR